MTNKRYCRIFLCFFLLSTLGCPVFGVAQTDKVISIVPDNDSEHHKYCRELLKLALSYSTTKYIFEDFAAAPFAGPERDIIQLEQDKLDVVWLPTSNHLETHARAIYVPLYRGLLGKRILLIKKGDQHRFQQVQSLDDLRAFTFGQGSDWPDTTILKANNFQLITTQRYDSLFRMLDGGRFDAFPRGLFEPWSEMHARPDLKMEVEERILLSYRMPMYFFVAKNNISLAKEIEQGLYKAIDDGAFNKHFFNNPMIKEALEKANVDERKIFYIDNPELPPATPLENKKLWWSPLQDHSSIGSVAIFPPA